MGKSGSQRNDLGRGRPGGGSGLGEALEEFEQKVFKTDGCKLDWPSGPWRAELRN